MSLELARKIGQALDVRSQSKLRAIDLALRAYVRLTPQSPTTPMNGTIDAAQVVSGTFANARIAASNVTQHQAALQLAASQVVSGTFANARISEASVTQHEAALELDALQVSSGQFANARISEASVTQHQAALSIAETQIPDGAILARVASPETISGAWNFAGRVQLSGVQIDTFAAQQDNYSIGAGVNVLRIALTGNQTLTGIGGNIGGRLLMLHVNDGADSLTLAHESAASNPVNRILLPNTANMVIPPRGGATLLYDAARWHCVGAAL